MNKKHSGWVGVDLDGTLAHWNGFKGEDFVGAPIDPMVQKVRKMLYDGVDVRIFTARKPHPAIKRWCKEHLGKVLPITSIKDPEMICLYDDRAVSVERNTGRIFSKDAENQGLKKG